MVGGEAGRNHPAAESGNAWKNWARYCGNDIKGQTNRFAPVFIANLNVMDKGDQRNTLAQLEFMAGI